jgi:putative redox protein
MAEGGCGAGGDLMTEKSVEIHHDGGLRMLVRTGSGHDVVMDDAKGDSGARPTELLIAALGGCAGMDVLSLLRKKGQVITRFDSRIRATQRAAYPEIFTDIELEVDVEGPAVSVEAVREAIELAARKYCSVGAMLAAGETVIHHRYRVIGTGSVPFEETGEAMVSGPYARPDAL